MSNNKTRKGLAFSALVALGASLIAGIPAHAAGGLNLIPSAGTGLSTIASETFNLRTYFSAGQVGNINNIRYQVTSAQAVTATSGLASDTVVPATSHVIDIAGNTVGAASTVALSVANITASADVIAYEDVDSTGTLTAPDVAQAAVTVKFVKLADVTGHINLDTPAAGDTAVTGQVVFDGINESQLQQLPVVSLSLYNGREVSETSLGNATVTAGTLTFTRDVAPLADNSIVRARGTFDGSAFGGVNDARTVAKTIDSNVASIVKGANALANGDIRANSPFQAQSYVSKTIDAVDTAVAGVNVVGSVSASIALDADHTVTVNGTTYKDTTDLNTAKFKAVSDAKGLVKLDVTTTGFVAGDQVYFDFLAQNILDQVDATVVDPAYNVIDVADNLNNNIRTVAKGGSVSVTYQAVDQFGQAPKDGTFIIKVKGVDGNAADVPPVSAPVVGGKATLTVASKSTSALGQHNVIAELWENVTTETIVTPTLRAEEIGGFDLWVVTSAEATAAKITVTGGTEVASHDYALNASTFTAQDARLAGKFGYDAVDNKGTINSAVNYTAVVTANDVATQPLPGAAVTISAPGLWIASEGEAGWNYGVGSLTVLAAENGAVNFTVYSHKAGKVDVTVTSGAATKTVTVNKFIADAAVAITSVTASASLTTGRVVLVQFNVVDQYGNAAEAATGVEATVTGAGYLVGKDAKSGTTVPVAFAAGAGSVQLVDGADELGTSTVTATLSYLVDGKTVTKTAASTYTFGQTDANLNISGKRVTADWVFAAGKTVTITRDGVTIRTFHPTANSADSFSFNLKKSKRAHRVTIKVNGVTITDAGYLVKK